MRPQAGRAISGLLLASTCWLSAWGQDDRFWSRHVQDLVRLCESLGHSLSPELAAALANAAGQGPGPVEPLLDRHCLALVHINPESRVKVARGPAQAVLEVGRPACYLVRVDNEAGVTQPLAVTGPQIRLSDADQPLRGAWLQALVRHPSGRLSGQRVEYVILRLVADQAGKREATLIFDVGQGTQDLGFRAEVPILFTIRPRP
jgi:hypothetical protein